MKKPETLWGWVGYLGGVGVIGTILSATWTGGVAAVDYIQNIAHKDEVAKSIERISESTQNSLDDMERRRLRQEIFKIDAMPKHTHADEAMRRLYQSDLDELNKKKGR